MGHAHRHIDEDDEAIDPEVRYACEVNFAASLLEKNTAVGLVVVDHLLESMAKRAKRGRLPSSGTPTPTPIGTGASLASGKDESCPPGAQVQPLTFAEDGEPVITPEMAKLLQEDELALSERRMRKRSPGE